MYGERSTLEMNQTGVDEKALSQALGPCQTDLKQNTAFQAFFIDLFATYPDQLQARGIDSNMNQCLDPISVA